VNGLRTSKNKSFGLKRRKAVADASGERRRYLKHGGVADARQKNDLEDYAEGGSLSCDKVGKPSEEGRGSKREGKSRTATHSTGVVYPTFGGIMKVRRTKKGRDKKSASERGGKKKRRAEGTVKKGKDAAPIAESGLENIRGEAKLGIQGNGLDHKKKWAQNERRGRE